MISVIIPLLPIDPYDRVINDCIESLKAQTVTNEIIISKQPATDRYILKNMLLNQGFERATGDIVFHCDADFILEDRTTLERMQAKIKKEGYDVVFPKFWSPRYDALKIADGGPCFRKITMFKHGPLKEDLKGISWVTFPFVSWCLEHTKYYCGDDITLTHQRTGGKGRRNGQTASTMRPLFKQTVKRLVREGAWPV
ncbi:MAG: hypothetical protein A2W01_11225 [Candidatus Solincola sediminis]|nr:MAG: hypothetical protein A2W01_11225 [Candidatus Solincola sediminis]